MWGEPLKRRVGGGLWLLLAVVLWNVSFDHQVRIIAGRALGDAVAAARRTGSPVRLTAAVTPQLEAAAVYSSLTAGGALVLGAWLLLGRRRRQRLRPDGSPATRHHPPPATDHRFSSNSF